MNPKKISQRFAQNLQMLLRGETVNASAFTNKKQLQQLEEDRVVARLSTGRNRAMFQCRNPEALRNCLRLKFGITDLDAYVALLGDENLDGESSLRATTSTKALRSQGMQGFFIKSQGSAVKLNGESLADLPDGVAYFVHDPEALDISPEALVVGIENPECFLKVERLLDLFPKQELIFVMRYHSLSPVRWLQSIPNHYLHFGDFDPAGIAIYCNEYLARLGDERCRFLVPDGIETLVEDKGQTELYDSQQLQWPPKVEIIQSDLLRLISVIDRCGKGLEQESLLA